jgi:single-strand DNA-binding protein
MNYTHIAGHLGADPETRFTPSGQKVTTLRVACRSRKDDTIWYKVTIWGDQFDKLLTYCKKGSAIVVMGELMKPEIYTDREGKPQISLQMVAYHIGFSPFGKGKAGESTGASAAAPNVNRTSPAPFNDAGMGGFDDFEASHASGGGSGGGFSDEEIPF